MYHGFEILPGERLEILTCRRNRQIWYVITSTSSILRPVYLKQFGHLGQSISTGKCIKDESKQSMYNMHNIPVLKTSLLYDEF